MKKILILTGPGGVGKTAIAKLLAKQCGFIWLDGDCEDSEFFPKGKQWLSRNSAKLRKAHEKILQKTIRLARKNKKVVVDYIIFGRYLEFFNEFEKEFGNDFEIRVLFPDVKECVERDFKRKCWTTGNRRIKAVYADFNNIKNKIGADKFIDSTGQTPRETFEKYFKC